MQQRHSINRGGAQNWVNAHKNKNIHGVRESIFGNLESRKFCGFDVIDQAAEKQMSRGYTKKKNPVCEKCFTQKSVSGMCNCTL